MPLTSKVDSLMPHSPSPELSPLHVIFYLKIILVVTFFNKGEYQKAPFHTVIFKPGLMEFM
jgi:hypothetical protein